MKKRLKLKKVTIQDLDEGVLETMVGAGGTVNPTCDQNTCQQTCPNTCAQTCASCGTCGSCGTCASCASCGTCATQCGCGSTELCC